MWFENIIQIKWEQSREPPEALAKTHLPTPLADKFRNPGQGMRSPKAGWRHRTTTFSGAVFVAVFVAVLGWYPAKCLKSLVGDDGLEPPTLSV